ncbi:MAG: hypothetical protein JXA69_11990 [Phycisphaerae bacterium]|nr:hypothetical protein [Phycisphaerae bacterium]
MVRLLRVLAVVIVFVIVVCAGGLASATPVTLAHGGEPAVTIVVPARVPKVIVSAATAQS